MAVRINASMLEYRESILAFLQGEGHCVLDSSLANFCLTENQPQQQQISNLNSKKQKSEQATSNQLAEIINTVKEENYQAECEAIAAAPDLSEKQYHRLKKQVIKTVLQRRSLRKYELFRRYCNPDTAQLVILDDQDWHRKIRLHYFLTIGRQYLAERDGIIAQQLVNQGDGSLFLPDFNESQLGAAIGTLEVLGIPVLLANPERRLCGQDKDLQRLLEIAINNRSEIKTVLGIGIAINASPIVVIRRLLDKIGCGLTCTGTVRINKKSVRTYQISLPDDSRQKVFQKWFYRDNKYPGSSEFSLDNYRKIQEFQVQSEPIISNDYIQLSLKLG
jgi:hypothetical protein